MFKTVRARLFIPVLCALVIGSLLWGVIGQIATSGVITDAFNEDGQRSAGNLCNNVDKEIARAQTDLMALSASPSVIELLEGDREREQTVETFIQTLVEINDLYHSIAILNTAGNIVASTTVHQRGFRGDRAFFIQNMRGEEYISRGVEMNREIGRLTLSLSVPVRSTQDGGIIGAALTVIRLDKLSDRHVAPVRLLGDHGYALVATHYGQLIATNKIGERPGTSAMISDVLLQNLLDMPGGGAVFGYVVDGEPVMVFAEQSPLTEWFTVVICPTADFYGQSNRLARFNTLLAAVLIIAQASIIWLVVRGITRALTTTVRYSEAVAKGDLNSTLAVQRTDEVGVLAQSLRVMVSELIDKISLAEKKTAEAHAATEMVMEGINYASKIQRNLLPDDSVIKKAMSDYHIIWEPRDIVGGDIYWAKNFNNGTVLCVCDCTGHSTPGALLTMLLVSTFESVIREGTHTDTAEIICQLDRHLAAVLHVDEGDGAITNIKDGCDLAVLFIADNGDVYLSAGNTNVFVCDGKEVTRYKGQSIFVGTGEITNKAQVNVHHIPAKAENRFYIASDGLFDQIGGGGKNIPWGYKHFTEIVLAQHNESQATISQKLMEAFETHQGKQPRRDDMQLIAFKPRIR